MPFEITMQSEKMAEPMKYSNLICASVVGISGNPTISGISVPTALLTPGELDEKDIVAFYFGTADILKCTFVHETESEIKMTKRMAMFLAVCASKFGELFSSSDVSDAFEAAAEVIRAKGDE